MSRLTPEGAFLIKLLLDVTETNSIVELRVQINEGSLKLPTVYRRSQYLITLFKGVTDEEYEQNLILYRLKRGI